MDFDEDFAKFLACLQEYAQKNNLNENQVLNAFAKEMLKQRNDPHPIAQGSQQIQETPKTNIDANKNVKQIIDSKDKPNKPKLDQREDDVVETKTYKPWKGATIKSSILDQINSQISQGPDLNAGTKKNDQIQDEDSLEKSSGNGKLVRDANDGIYGKTGSIEFNSVNDYSQD